MSKIRTLHKLWHSDKSAILTACFNNLNNLGLFRWLGDRPFLSMAYYVHTGHRLHWDKPERFTEKIQWLKVYDRKEEYTSMVDKISAKDYVASIIGNEYIIPTYGVWECFDDIDFDSLPEQFVLKTSNGSGSNGVVVCTDKKRLDKKAAKKRLEASLKCNTYYNLREWPYKNIKPRIFAEQYITEPHKEFERRDLTDYKIFCFKGKAKYCQVIQNRSQQETIDFYNENWEYQPFIGLNPQAKHVNDRLPKPLCYENMLAIAESLAKGHQFIRVDLYVNEEQPLFGEVTFFPASGLGIFQPDDYDFILGQMIELEPTGGGKCFVIEDGEPVFIESELRDYKFFCSHGNVRFFKIDFNRFVGHRANYYNAKGELLPYGEVVCPPDFKAKIALPTNINEMIVVAERLSQGFKLLRVDLYNVQGKVLFGELTLYPASGLEKFTPDQSDEELGKMIDLLA